MLEEAVAPRSRPLAAGDEWTHPVGPQVNWNESRYADFCDRSGTVSGWLRHGFLVNAGTAEITVCLHLPDGSVLFGYDRLPVAHNGLDAGGLRWEVAAPYEVVGVSYAGTLTRLADGRALADPRRAFADGRPVRVGLALTLTGYGLESVLGADLREIDQIFLPGQADGHYQLLGVVTGTVDVDGDTWVIDGHGGRDHSWGPRNWHYKRSFRWLTGSVDRDFGFMLTSTVGAQDRRAGGMVWIAGARHLVEHLTVRTSHDGAGYPVSTTATFGAACRTWSITGSPLATVPLRHRRAVADGPEEVLRIVKAPTRWELDDGRCALGIAEHHDLLEDGLLVGGPE
jgi:hypothetical protein